MNDWEEVVFAPGEIVQFRPDDAWKDRATGEIVSQCDIISYLTSCPTMTGEAILVRRRT